MPITSPRLGAALSDVRGVAELHQLKALKMSGCPTPSVECIEVRLCFVLLARLIVCLSVWGSVAELHQLKALKTSGCPTPSVECIEVRPMRTVAGCAPPLQSPSVRHIL